mmetsp:Transcript_37502/g.120728  ORF Transcript_37502/g.120728 Transcript_37502/m.120728 type:complete len:100 (-) Transcript_37502:44-343(-)
MAAIVDAMACWWVPRAAEVAAAAAAAGAAAWAPARLESWLMAADYGWMAWLALVMTAVVDANGSSCEAHGIACRGSGCVCGCVRVVGWLVGLAAPPLME